MLVCLISACVLFHYINVFVRFVCGLMCVLCGFCVLLVCACVRVGLKVCAVLLFVFLGCVWRCMVYVLMSCLCTGLNVFVCVACLCTGLNVFVCFACEILCAGVWHVL